MNWSNLNVDISKSLPIFPYHCAKLTVQNKWLEPGLLWVFRTKSLLRLETKLGKDELSSCSFRLLYRKSFRWKHWNIIHRWKKMLTSHILAWHKSVLVEQTGPTASQYCQMRCIAGQNMWYSKYIAMLMDDRWSQQQSQVIRQSLIGINWSCRNARCLE